ncbi:eukaryotic-like serine/threonine-protein kinase [Gammaproteobacteria bacterium]
MPLKTAFWKKDWFVGIAVSLLVIVTTNSDLLQGLERKAYDLGVQANDRVPSDKVAIIAIDDQSIANLGRWPWPRDVQAKLLDILSKGGTKVIGNTVFYTEPQVDRGLVAIRDELNKRYDNSSLPGLHAEAVTLKNLLDQATASLAGHPAPKPRTPEEREHQVLTQLATFLTASSYLVRAPEDATHLRELLTQTEGRLDLDRYLAQAIRRAGNVVLGIGFDLGRPEGRPDRILPDYLRRNALTKVSDEVDAANNGLMPLSAVQFLAPLAEFGGAATAIGHLTVYRDVDGAVRSEPIVLDYFGEYYPSISLVLAAKYLNLKPEDMRLRLGEGVQLGRLNLPTDSYLRMYPHFYPDKDGRGAFPVDSFFDVYNNKISPTKYAGKIVIIGTTAKGVGDAYPTPASPATSSAQILAHEVSSILQSHFYKTPEWANWVEWLITLVLVLYLTLGLPHLKAGTAAIATALLLIGLVVAHFVLMTGPALWLHLMVPVVLLITGHLLLTTKRYLVTEKGKEAADSAASESNRMLGLAFQNQGQLDMAFEKFRRSPMDNALLELLYNLALDFERKRQYAKAGSVFSYMADYEPKFRDIQDRLRRNRNLEETMVLGGARATSPGGTLVMSEEGTQKPMLGRYQVERELGRGAMGAVYLGRDPKINRVVAIKTIALSQEFDGNELIEVKQRFFREAETAGRLSHPCIVTIYDAGEEHDLAYIAMELLKGKDLAGYTTQDRLLPVATVLDLVRRVAEALAYAHAQSVVHRDIKPANIMYEPDTGTIKVTDFGIARITDSSKTKTGMVMGTPSYMSPEQLSGQKVDGRSDLFSLGVMFYQLLTGELPFTADSMATLMYRIANVAHRDIRELRTDLAPCLSTIINKVLEKDASKRYQNGTDLAQDIASCAETLARGGTEA